MIQAANIARICVFDEHLVLQCFSWKDIKSTLIVNKLFKTNIINSYTNILDFFLFRSNHIYPHLSNYRYVHNFHYIPSIDIYFFMKIFYYFKLRTVDISLITMFKEIFFSLALAGL